MLLRSVFLQVTVGNSTVKFAIIISGGARVFAVQDKRLYCRPRQSDQFCNHGILFRISDIKCKPTLGGPLPSLLYHSISSPLRFHSPIPTSSRPLACGLFTPPTRRDKTVLSRLQLYSHRRQDSFVSS